MNETKKHKCAGPFLKPVDYIGLNLMDYPEIIKEPMDLSTVAVNLHKGHYLDASEFLRDMRLIWSNSLTYNE